MGATFHRFLDEPKMNRQAQATMSGRDLLGRKETQQRSTARNQTGNDLSAFGITLTLVFALATAAAHSDHPLLWLIVGPVAIVLLFFIASLLHVCLPHISAKRSHPRSGRVLVSSEKSLIRPGYAKLAPEC
jgi:hypothetical protein